MNDKDVKRKETTGENDFVLKSLKISSRVKYNIDGETVKIERIVR